MTSINTESPSTNARQMQIRHKMKQEWRTQAKSNAGNSYCEQGIDPFFLNRAAVQVSASTGAEKALSSTAVDNAKMRTWRQDFLRGRPWTISTQQMWQEALFQERTCDELCGAQIDKADRERRTYEKCRLTATSKKCQWTATVHCQPISYGIVLRSRVITAVATQ
mmetsp:Transcript_18922/g.36750  ORF Transcript_18922/g.36750 Transcript_18922/m.36750 type:complete len:165 (-) Transcript_18922:188-682(-)